MKNNLLKILLLFFVSIPLFPEGKPPSDSTESPEAVPPPISFDFFITGFGMQPTSGMSLFILNSGYNLNDIFTVAGSLYGTKVRMELGGGDSATLSIGKESHDFSNMGGLLSLRMKPFAKIPVYIGPYVSGVGPGGSMDLRYQTYMTFWNFTPRVSSIGYTVDQKAYITAGVLIGTEWVSRRGFTMGFQIGRSRLLSGGEKKIQYFYGPHVILYPESILTLEELLITDYMVRESYGKKPYSMGWQNIYFGWSFNL